MLYEVITLALEGGLTVVLEPEAPSVAVEDDDPLADDVGAEDAVDAEGALPFVVLLEAVRLV